MSAARNMVFEMADRKMKVAEAEDRATDMPQSSDESFGMTDRRELYKQSAQLELVVRDLGEMRLAIKDNARTHAEAIEAHEKRLRVLEDAKLEQRTQITTALQTSRLWMVGISGLVGAVVSVLVRILFK